MMFLSKYKVADRLEKRPLLIAVNLVAGLSIFFFGYDQGVSRFLNMNLHELTRSKLMGGVNTARDYAELMGFGHWDADAGLVKVDNSLLQGGIVSFHLSVFKARLTLEVAVYYLPGTLFGAWWGGWIGDRYGRINGIGFAALWAIVGATLQCSAQNAEWMFCGRSSTIAKTDY